ncbi:aspartate kinase [Streptomyces sp. 1114.5]|uniref:aspartate kinase n=1 Tax=unclassified Streptomyces TaxID=2593676 RepID=UPI000BDB2D39|nr:MULTISPECIES: aspartate kinase [unclassified Streptomyces]RKT11376.1 aspartate kinase [Streptomyces sp. 1114.5]SOB81261.1 aspartate kinase [Streptomyces sp. 1331.2]
MALIVQKYGGTSVATPEKIIEAARQARAAREDGHQVVVVVSAMGGATDGLLRLASAVSDHPEPRELDGLLSTGEAASSALLALALNQQGVSSRSFSGAEAGIRTDHRHGRAAIVKVDPRRLREELGRGTVPVVAGFQGESVLTGACTTLGRGGSDTTGVALAAALDADHCEIVTDVAGVYTADPRSVVGARRHAGLSYEEMAELAVSGAKVLAADSVDYARTHGVELKVRANNSATGPKTWVGHGRSAGGPTPGDSWTANGQSCPIAGVAGRSGLVRCVLRRIGPDHVLRLLRELAERETEVELRRYGNYGTEDLGDIALTLPEESAEELRELLADSDRGIRLDEAHWTSNLSRLSVVGLGIGRRPYAPLRLLEALRSVDAARTDVHVTSNRISVLTGRSDLAEATQIVHDTFVTDPEVHRIEATDSDDADPTWSLTAERGRLDVAVPALAAAE